jgi:hypothetical protein
MWSAHADEHSCAAPRLAFKPSSSSSLATVNYGTPFMCAQRVQGNHGHLCRSQPIAPVETSQTSVLTSRRVPATRLSDSRQLIDIAVNCTVHRRSVRRTYAVAGYHRTSAFPTRLLDGDVHSRQKELRTTLAQWGVDLDRDTVIYCGGVCVRSCGCGAGCTGATTGVYTAALTG